MLRFRRIVVAVATLAVVALPGPVAAAPGDGFVYQSRRPAPLADARTYILLGTRTADGCRFDYPDLVLGVGETTRLQRDIGIDQAHCRKLVEEGIPTTDVSTAGVDPTITSITAPIGQRTATGAATGPAVLTSSTVSSGYHKTWYENFLGQLLSGDTTYITWIWNGSCATSGSTYGEWSWNTFYGWAPISYGGTDNLTCARYQGETHATFGLGSCRHYYYYVRALGSNTGGITGTYSEHATCGPVWFHSSVQKTT